MDYLALISLSMIVLYPVRELDHQIVNAKQEMYLACVWNSAYHCRHDVGYNLSPCQEKQDKEDMYINSEISMVHLIGVSATRWISGLIFGLLAQKYLSWYLAYERWIDRGNARNSAGPRQNSLISWQ
jgi:hypothetical protein